jgi:hypothetical protein
MDKMEQRQPDLTRAHFQLLIMVTMLRVVVVVVERLFLILLLQLQELL